MAFLMKFITWDMIQGYIRHALTGMGGVIIAKGYVSGSDWTDAVGALMVLIGVLHSAYIKWNTVRVATTAAGTIIKPIQKEP